MEEKQYTIAIKYSVGVEVFATSEAEALEKAKKQIGVADGKFNDVSYKIKAKRAFGPVKEKTAEIPFAKKNKKS
jgi:orotidine-5'-phosphate decarboxylase